MNYKLMPINKNNMKIKNYTTMKISKTFCSLKTTAAVFLLGVFLLTSTVASAQNHALDFDGINNYVSLPASINDEITGNNATIEGWFYFRAIPGDFVQLVGETYSSPFDINVKFSIYMVGGSINVGFVSSNNLIGVSGTPLVAADLNKWIHIAGTYDATNLTLYINGSQAATIGQTTPLPATNGEWVLGRQTDDSFYFNGKMDEIRIWNSTRTAAEVLANYRKQVSVASSGLIAYYQMDQGVAGGDNTAITALTNSSNVLSLNGTLTGPFTRTGATSNFVETGIPTVYNGGWSQGAPDVTRDAIIEGDYSVAASITANTLTVNNGAVVTIPSGSNVTVASAVTVTSPATLTLSNNANLIQLNNVANTGNITVNRNSSSLQRLDYTLWSSPVTGPQTLAGFSPLTDLSRFYQYNTGTNLYSPIAAGSTFGLAKGYLIRMPNTDSFAGYDAGSTRITFPGVFTGIPNNGDVPVTLTNDANPLLRYNLVGNPYPSPVSLTTFVTENTDAIESNIYFWRKTNGAGTAYCTWVPGGATGTFTTNGNSQSADPLGVLQTGQGFFVQAKTGQTEAIFKNTQRVADNSNKFFKASSSVVVSRIWLNATNVAGDFSQMALAYNPKATIGVDMYDGKYINDSPFALTSNINNQEYTIQGRPSFDPIDVVLLNFKTSKAGEYTIAIDRVDGLFLGNQPVYLVDSATGVETDLKNNPYTFTAAAGVDNSRFSLKFQKTLSLDSKSFDDNSVIVYKNGGVIFVNSGIKMISNVKVFDIQGRVVSELNNVKANTTSIQNLRVSNQILIVKVTTDDNVEISRKVEN